MKEKSALRFNTLILLIFLPMMYLFCLFPILIGEASFIYTDWAIIATLFFSMFENRRLSPVTIVIFGIFEDIIYGYPVLVSTVACSSIYFFIININERLLKLKSNHLLILVYSTLLIAFSLLFKFLILSIMIKEVHIVTKFAISTVIYSAASYCVLYWLYFKIFKSNLSENA